jgi:PKD repeat protein
LLQSLYSAGTATPPFYSYQHTGSASITAAAFYIIGNYPAQYRNALFFGDYAVGWIKVMFPDANGTPNPANMQTFISTGTSVVDLQTGPGGDIFYVDLGGNRVRRIEYLQGNNAPNAVIQASVTSGNAPLQVSFVGSASSDPDAGDTITYSWDLNGDTVFGDATTANASYTYTLPGNYAVKLRVTDSFGASDTKGVTISVNNLPPVPEILTPTSGTTFRAGDTISFSGRATDPETGLLAASQLSWQVVLLHCSDVQFTDCHEHPVLTSSGTATGQFLTIDHEYPCYTQIRLTATEPGPNGLSVTTTRDLLPQLTTLTLQTNPPGLQVGAFSQTSVAPLVKQVIVNGETAITAPSPQTIGVQTYVFSSWSDGGAQSHNVHFGAAPLSVTANFALSSGGTNNPPVLGALWAQTVTEGNGIGFYISASDPDGPVPTLSATNMPGGAQLISQSNGSAYFEWFTQPGDAGDHTITITATDSGIPPLSVSGNLVIHVLSGNAPPSMDTVWNTQVNAGKLINLRIGAWDTDGDVPDLFAQNLPPGAAYSDDGWGTGFFTWQTTTGDVGVYTGIRIYAVDHGIPPLTNERVFQIKVLGSANAPVIDPVPSSTVVAGDTLTLNVFGYDPNGTTPVLTAQNLPAGATFAATGGGNGVFSWPTTANDVGNHSGLVILATDSVTPSLKFKAMFNVNVVGAGQAPVLNPIGAQAAAEGIQLQFTVTATDPDSGPPALSVIDLPFGATFIDLGTGAGTFTWTPEAGAAANSPYPVTFVAADDSDTDSEIVEITVAHPNGPPHLETIGTKSGVEGTPLLFTVNAHDHDGTIPALTACGLPSGASFVDHSDGTGSFAWTPPVGATANSPFAVSFYASDDEFTVSETISIAINAAAAGAPVLSAFGPYSIAEGEVWSANVSASDPDGTTPSLSAPVLPAGASFVNNGNGTGSISWTPDFNAAAGSPYTVTIVASDGTLTDSKSTTITVANTNRAPVTTAVGDKTVAENQLLQFNVTASDPDGTVPTLTAQTLPTGATFVDNGNGTGTFTWTPDFNAAATLPYTVTFIASDGTLTDSKSSTITVTNTNRAPAMTAVGNKTVAENQLLQFNVTGSDPDGTVPVLTAQTLPTGATFVNNANGTGTFTWTPDFNAAATSPYTVTFVASDGTLTDSKSSTITVTNTNRAPAMTAVGNKTVAENQLLQFNVTGSDPDGTVPTLTAQTLPTGATFINNGNGTGTFTWTPDFNAAAASPYTVTFVASDGTLTDSKSSTTTVTNTNRAPAMTAVGNKSVGEGQLLQFNVTASDPDGTVPALTAQSLPTGATFVNNDNGTGTFTWTPSAGASTGSPYTVTFTASDGTLSDSKSSTITVSATNHAPVMAVVGDKTVAENQLLQFNVTATDPDGTVPTLTAQSVPTGATFVNNGNGTGTFTWTPDFNAAAASPYTVTFVASDGSLTDSKSSIISVTNTNRAPIMPAIGNKTAAVGQLLQFTVTASDPDGTVPTLSAQSVPSGATFVNNGNGTGTFSWTPASGAVTGSPYTVSFTASDGSLTDSKSSVIAVTTSTNRPPVFATIWGREVTAGSGIGFYITATDPDGGVPVYSSPNLPAGARLIVFQGNPSIYFEWFPTAGQAGDYNITIVATDAGSPPLSASETFLIRVLAGNVAPKMDPVYDQTVTAGALINLRIGAWDTDGDIPTLTAQNLPPGSTYTSDNFGTGFFRWQTSTANVGVYPNITIIATDHGNPPLSSQRVFKVTVNAP